MKIEEIFKKRIQEKSGSHVVVNTVLYNAIVKIIQDEKDIDITDEIVSVNMKGDFFILKLKRSILREEIQQISGIIEGEIYKKLEKLGKKPKKVKLLLR